MKTITQLFKDYRLGLISADELYAEEEFEDIAEEVAVNWLNQVAKQESSAQMAAEVIFIQDLIRRHYTESLVSWIAEQYLQNADVYVSAKLFTMLEILTENMPDADHSEAWLDDLKSILRCANNPRRCPLPKHLAEWHDRI